MSKSIELKHYELPTLPYKLNALEPHISEQIMDVHYNGHHKAYVNGANAVLDKIDNITKGSVQGYDMSGIVRNLVFNVNGHKLHTMFWNSMAPEGKGGGKPGGALADLIDKQFGSFEIFKQFFNDSMKSLTGTGWTVLLFDKEINRLEISTIENHFINHIAELPVLQIVDEFEHAYYLQYKNNRNAYLDAWWNLADWDSAEKRLKRFI
ncbi:MAG: superoxide dismutase [Candidatus Micrarchaeia archaeon]